MSSEDRAFPILGTAFDLIAIPFNFLSGYLIGVVAPIAAIAAIVAGIRFLTGQVPFLGDLAEDEEGGRRLSLQLMSTEQAKVQFEEQKELIGAEIVQMKDEIQAIIEEAKADAQAEALDEVEEEIELV